MSWANWERHAAWLAGQVTEPASRWRSLVAAVPRHEFLPRWWAGGDGGWQLRDGPAMPVEDWLGGVYRDVSLVTQVGTLHADHATQDDRSEGRPTSSGTMPGLVVTMYRYAMIGDGLDVLDVGTGTGYGTALLARRLGDEHVTSVDIDPYLAKAAEERLAGLGLRPHVMVADATGPLPGEYDRIVSMTSVAPVPASWLAALRPGGRLVTTLAGTGLVVTANRTRDGGAKARRSSTGPGLWRPAGAPTTRPRYFSRFPVRSTATTGTLARVGTRWWTPLGRGSCTPCSALPSLASSTTARTSLAGGARRGWPTRTGRGLVPVPSATNSPRYGRAVPGGCGTSSTTSVTLG